MRRESREKIKGRGGGRRWVCTPHRRRCLTRRHLSLSLPLSPSFQTVDRTDLFEGSVIRAVRRLDELLAQLAAAARVVGDARLASAFEAASAAIRRDIVFAASLYV